MIRESTPGGGAGRAREEDFGSDRMTQHARDAARDVTEQAKQKASEAARKIKDSGTQAINQQKSRLSKIVNDLASALYDAGDELTQKGDRMLGSYTHTIADQVQRAGQYLQEHDTRDLLNRTQNLVRQNPAIFLGAMFIVGLGAARFFKSSSQRSAGESEMSMGESQYSSGQGFGERPDLGVGESISGGRGEVYPEPGNAPIESIGGPISEFDETAPAPQFVEPQSGLAGSDFDEEPNPSRTPDRPDYEEEI